MTLRSDADFIIKESIQRVLPDEAVAQALKNKEFGTGKLVVVAAGKAAWQMAKAASDLLEDRIDRGVVVTKYDHVNGPIDHMTCFEAGHPVPDENSFIGTQAAIDLVSNLQKEDTVLFYFAGHGAKEEDKGYASA